MQLRQAIMVLLETSGRQMSNLSIDFYLANLKIMMSNMKVSETRLVEAMLKFTKSARFPSVQEIEDTFKYQLIKRMQAYLLPSLFGIAALKLKGNALSMIKWVKKGVSYTMPWVEIYN